MIQLQNVSLSLSYSDSDLLNIAAKQLRISADKILSVTLSRRSVDARKKDNIHFVANLDVKLKDGISENSILNKSKNKSAKLVANKPYKLPDVKPKPKDTPVVIGAGPAGLFAAYILALAGQCPLVIERGQTVEKRVKAVENFFGGGPLNPSSNIQFGEGGAGTFSDGKLHTGIKDERIRFVLETFHECGAPDDILYLQKPHIGTDMLRSVIVNLREKIKSLGGSFLFETTFEKCIIENQKLCGIIVSQSGVEREIPCEKLILAIGHSARDTFENLYNSQICMEQKPFAMGVRIEHTQEFINTAQYGSCRHPALSAADYKLAVHLESGRGVYTFCMCPGGTVVAAASEVGGVVTNGMSVYARNAVNANSALLVGVAPEDLNSNHPLAGVELQRQIERSAYNISGSYKAPAQTVGGFLNGTTPEFTTVKPSYLPDVVNTDLRAVLPSFIADSLRDGIILMDKKIKGFADPNAVLTGPETRSSSPVRILRDETLQSNIRGIYPCGEGAGYAGGITSAAVDGIKCAECILK